MIFRKPLRSRSGEGGFTMVETLIVLAIAAMLLLIAIPYFGKIMRQSRVDSAARDFQTTLLSARLEAIKRGNNVGLEISTDSSSIAYLKPTLFVDANANGALDNGETVIRTVELPAAMQSFFYAITAPNKADPTSSAAATAVFEFTPFGSALTVPATTSTEAFYVCDAYKNVLQVAIPNPTTGKPATTKQLVSGSTTSYVDQPWTWY